MYASSDKAKTEISPPILSSVELTCAACPYSEVSHKLLTVQSILNTVGLILDIKHVITGGGGVVGGVVIMGGGVTSKKIAYTAINGRK